MSHRLKGEFPPGLYESVVDRDLSALVSQFAADRAVLSSIDDADLPHVLAQHVAKVFERRLRDTKKENRLKLASSVLSALESNSGFSSDDSNSYLVLTDDKPRAQYLAEVKETPLAKEIIRPSTSLNEAALMTNAEHDVSLQAELSKEFASADRVDAIIAFVKWTGLTTLDHQFRQLRARGVPIRIITTTYTGATDRKALDHLVKEYGVQVKVNYKTTSTRLHAKAWMIYRKTGFHTAFVGSSNLSHSAIVDGLEWNVRIARTSTPAVFDKLESTFESYWNSPSFESYDPKSNAEKFDLQILEARGGKERGRGPDFTVLDIRPYAYQQAMLEALEASRNQGYHRNLLVAATGTGKTVIAAFDYKKLRDRFESELGRPPRTLFIAHRDLILHQTHQIFCDVNKIPNLGFVRDSTTPVGAVTTKILADHENLILTTIQSLKQKNLRSLDRNLFDIVIIDEFHHAHAPSYRAVIDYFNYRELLGLTATPERGDGTSVAHEFFDGRIASEMRLWDALEEELLCPFHYFVTADGTDLSQVKMRAGDYHAQHLSNVLTGNDARSTIILQAIKDKILEPQQMRALCFCVDIAHAQYMSHVFNKAKIKATYVTSRGSGKSRKQALKELKSGKLQIICAVDIFNEGVDIPQVDTILMLRPTQSPVVFLQQLGRGLRTADGKTVLTVLDFVGNQAKGFRFDRKLRALTRMRNKDLVHAVEEGFSQLPAGCHIQFDNPSQEIVLSSIRENLAISSDRLPAEIREYASFRNIEEPSLLTYRLHDYLTDADRKAADLYKGRALDKWRVSWERLLYKARTGKTPPEDEFDEIRDRFRAFCHVEDPERISAYRTLLVTDLSYEELDPKLQVYAHMLMYSVWPTGKRKNSELSSVDEALEILRSNPMIVEEICQIMEHAQRSSKHVFSEPKGPLSATPLKVGAQYLQGEMRSALGEGLDEEKLSRSHIQGGTHRCEESNTRVLLVTLVKSESDYSPHTLYRDYAITETLFHWESPSTTAPHTALAKELKNHESDGTKIALFIREHKVNDLGEGVPYTFAGPAHFVSSQGSRPMQIIWELEHPLPPDLFIAARAAAS